MLWIIVIHILSAHWIFRRTMKVSPQVSLSRIALHSGLIAMSVVIFPLGVLFSCFLIHASFWILVIEVWVMQRRQERFSYQHLRTLIDHTVYNMRSGKSYRSSLHESVRKLPEGWLKTRVQVWISDLAVTSLAASSDPLWRDIQWELQALDRQPHQALARLQSWRHRLKMLADFRRRSGQVLMQVQLQAILVSVLYFALLVFSFVRGVWRSYPYMLGASMVLFGLGLILIFRLGKRIRWSF